jgi:hypothetical protein
LFFNPEDLAFIAFVTQPARYKSQLALETTSTQLAKRTLALAASVLSHVALVGIRELRGSSQQSFNSNFLPRALAMMESFLQVHLSVIRLSFCRKEYPEYVSI